MSFLKLFSFSLIFVLSFLISSSAAETPLEQSIKQAEEVLEAWRTREADRSASQLLSENPKSAEVLELKAWIAYYDGRYEEALRWIEQALAVESTHQKRQALRLLLQQTRDTIGKLKAHESPHFILYLDEQRDGILAAHALDTLEKSYQAIGEILGYLPRGKVRVEIAPDVPSFNAISTLSLRDIEETGAVGICKFNKIMTISPRVLSNGYRWLDSLSHEYLHHAIVALSNNKAPIWLHEGMARYYETQWRAPPSAKERPDYLTTPNETLLARALSKNQFVGFKKMEPSLIHLESPEQVQLAYAEAASAVDFIAERKGHSGVRQLLAALKDRPTPDAIEQVVGLPYDDFETQWKVFLKGRGLKEVEGSRVRKLKVRGEQKQDEEAVELKEIQSVVARNRTQLADRLRERGRVPAAAAEYRRALQGSPHSTIILNKLGRVLIQLGNHDEALSHLKEAERLDPDNATTHLQLGRLYYATKKHPEARAALEEVVQINPFNPEIYQLLFGTYSAMGDTARAQEAKGTLEKLMSAR
jgi:tetratricopeptide (TPR) repeat protein